MEKFDEQQDIRVTDYLIILFRRRYIILFFLTVIFFFTALKTFLTKPVYEAISTIQIEERTRESQLLSELVIMSRWNPVNTESEILKSRTVCEEVVRELGLDKELTVSSKNISVNIETLSTDVLQNARVFEIKFKDDTGNFTVKDGEVPLLGNGSVGHLFSVQPLTFKIESTNAKKGDYLKVYVKPFNKAVTSIRNNLKVEDIGEQTNILLIKYRHQDPTLARNILNKLIEVYLKHNVARKSQDISQTLSFIDSQLNIIRSELELSELNLDKYKSEHGFVELSSETTSLINKISEFEKAKTELTLKRKQIEPLYNSLQSNDSLGSEFILPTLTTEDPIITTMVSSLTQLEIQRRTLLEDYTEKHPQIIMLTTQINESKKKILETLGNMLNAINQRESALSMVLKRYEENLKKIPQAERQFAMLTRSTKVNEEIYTFLLKKHEETRIAKAATVSSIRVIDPALLPEFPVEPKKKKNLIIGLIVGLFAGVSFAFIAEFFDDSIKSVEEVERKLNLPVYGFIPHFPDQFFEGAVSAEKERSKKSTPKLFTNLDPRSSVAEAYRTLRTNIQFAELEKPVKTILITSTGPAEGKSTTAINLSIAIAQTGIKTILVDCDLRKPSIHTSFGIPQEPGISNYLSSGAKIENITHRTQEENLAIIPCGVIPPNPAEILSTKKMQDFIGELKNIYDFIIIDTPPVLAVTDAAILASRIDAVFLVVQSGRATLQGITRARISLDNVHAPLKGVILNNLKAESFMKYGYYKYYYKYPYSHYSSPDAENKSIIKELAEKIRNWVNPFKKND